jgi:hypothetical protein
MRIEQAVERLPFSVNKIVNKFRKKSAKNFFLSNKCIIFIL